MHPRIVLSVGVALGLLHSVVAARADGGAEAEALIARGIELREKGRDDEALTVFKQALARSPSPRARAQVALAEQALGMWVLAEVDLSAALSADDPWIAKNRAALEGALAVVRKRLGSLEVRGTHGAEIFLDGVRLGTGAGPFRVEAGKRTLEVRAPGSPSTTRAVEIPAGGTARETVHLVTTREPESQKGVAAASRRVAAAEDPGRAQRLLGWGFVGVGAALLATGGAALLVRKSTVDEYNAACPGLGVEQPPRCDERASSARTWLTVAIITLAAGGVSTIAGFVLVAAAPARPRPAAAGAARGLRLACAPELAGLTCAGTF